METAVFRPGATNAQRGDDDDDGGVLARCCPLHAVARVIEKGRAANGMRGGTRQWKTLMPGGNPPLISVSTSRVALLTHPSLSAVSLFLSSDILYIYIYCIMCAASV